MISSAPEITLWLLNTPSKTFHRTQFSSISTASGSGPVIWCRHVPACVARRAFVCPKTQHSTCTWSGA